MSDDLFWLTEEQFARLKPLLPDKVRGVPRADDRRVISGIVHILKSGCRWVDAPTEYGPRKTLYNRFVRRGEKAQGIGRSRGGRTTKIHAITDRLCRFFRIGRPKTSPYLFAQSACFCTEQKAGVFRDITHPIEVR